jgi:hypothetical protein
VALGARDGDPIGAVPQEADQEVITAVTAELAASEWAVKWLKGLMYFFYNLLQDEIFNNVFRLPT